MDNLEFRYADIAETAEEGVVTAYLTRWDTVDAYESTFARGSFARTFRDAGPSRVRLFWDHTELIGRTLELRETDRGPMATGRINLATPAGQRAWEHVKAGDVTGVSFAFRVKADRRGDDGVRIIEDLDLYEWGPVIFPANDQADIVGIRSEIGDIRGVKTSLVQLINTIRGI